MKYSVAKMNNDLYKVTITSATDQEKELMEKPINEIEDHIYQHFDQAVKEKLGEKASIASVISDSNLPYEIVALISVETE